MQECKNARMFGYVSCSCRNPKASLAKDLSGASLSISLSTTQVGIEKRQTKGRGQKGEAINE